LLRPNLYVHWNAGDCGSLTAVLEFQLPIAHMHNLPNNTLV
jgi:hypothetical protein